MSDVADYAPLAALQAASLRTASKSQLSSHPADDAMDAEALAAFLSAHRYGVMATGDGDGNPHARPVAYLVDRGVFLVATVAGARLRHVRARPQASLVVTAGDADDHRVISVDGEVVIHEGDAYAARFAPIAGRWRAVHGDEPGWAVALLELVPRRIYSYAAPPSAG